MYAIEVDPEARFAVSVPVLVAGAGACGLCAGLAARDLGADVLVVERDRQPMGTTAMSTGLIPAAGAPDQAAAGIDDAPALFASDILAKTRGQTDAPLVHALAASSAETVAWLRERHGVPLSLVTGFLYPGHSRMRMFGSPNRTGAELMGALAQAAESAGVDVMTGARVRDLVVDGDGKVLGVAVERPDGRTERIGCGALILATCGFAGNAAMVARLIPEIEGAAFFGHPGADGAAIAWGEALGALLGDIGAYQGHGGLAYGHNIPILWPLIANGGFQVNRAGRRFSDESLGYSEQAVKVVAQPDRAAWSIFDEGLHTLMLQFDDYQEALKAGAILSGETVAALAAAAGLPPAALQETVAETQALARGEGVDAFGRDFTKGRPLAPPFRAARVTGALFHTQGGLCVEADGRVRRAQGGAFPNLFAGGGAARGVSGPGAAGYIAGNGLLCATTLGKHAGRAAAQLVHISGELAS